MGKIMCLLALHWSSIAYQSSVTVLRHLLTCSQCECFQWIHAFSTYLLQKSLLPTIKNRKVCIY